jgi:hypothetical protein
MHCFCPKDAAYIFAGSAEAQEALQKFTRFLEAEAEQGHISRNLEKKVLGTCLRQEPDVTSTLDGHEQAA